MKTSSLVGLALIALSSSVGCSALSDDSASSQDALRDNPGDQPMLTQWPITLENWEKHPDIVAIQKATTLTAKDRTGQGSLSCTDGDLTVAYTMSAAAGAGAVRANESMYRTLSFSQTKGALSFEINEAGSFQHSDETYAYDAEGLLRSAEVTINGSDAKVTQWKTFFDLKGTTIFSMVRHGADTADINAAKWELAGAQTMPLRPDAEASWILYPQASDCSTSSWSALAAVELTPTPSK